MDRTVNPAVDRKVRETEMVDAGQVAEKRPIL
jgi:hypothetical protein